MASSLGRELRDENRAERLVTRDRNRTVAAFATRGRSALYGSNNDVSKLLTVEAFQSAAQHDRDAGLYWLRSLELLNDREIDIILSNVPRERMSDTAAEFAKQLLLINKNRLLELKKDLQ
jgi:hypothetical protein